jgi:hypothetical protein
MENPQRTTEQRSKPLEKEAGSSVRAPSGRPPPPRPLVLWLAAASRAAGATIDAGRALDLASFKAARRLETAGRAA